MVSWTSDGEWTQVYKQIFLGTIEDKQHALEVMKVWRVRFAAKIPVAVEVTYRLLETLLGSKNLSKGLEQQSYAAAVLQFVGLLTEHLLKRNTMTIRTLGETIGLPEWVIDLRNTMAHGPLPSCFMLKKAVHFGLSWLKENHWDVQVQHNSMCVRIPYMNAIVGGEYQVTLDDHISLILHDMKLFEKDDIKYDNCISKLYKICKEKHAVERLCVVFVKCDHYKFSQALYNITTLEQESVPIDVVRLWKPMLNCVTNSHNIVVLLYVFVCSLCGCKNLAKKNMLAVWSMYLINSLCGTQDFKNLLLNECIKLLLNCNNDFYSSLLFKNLVHAMIENGEHTRLQELALLHNKLNSSKQKLLPDKSFVKSLDDILNESHNTPTVKYLPEVTWTMYNGASLASCPIGLVHEQSQHDLAKQLYGIKNWSLHKFKDQPKTCFEILDDDNFFTHDKVEEVSDNSFEDPCKVVEIESTSCVSKCAIDQNVCAIENVQLEPSRSESGFNEFNTEDWGSIAFLIDSF